jgi:hypothetical protein
MSNLAVVNLAVCLIGWMAHCHDDDVDDDDDDDARCLGCVWRRPSTESARGEKRGKRQGRRQRWVADTCLWGGEEDRNS